MAETDDENLGDLLAQASAERTHQAVKAHTGPGTRKPDQKLGIISVSAMVVIGLALIGWAVYGAMMLRGVIESERDNAAFMAKLMLYGAGPLGVILLLAGVIMITQMLGKRR